ncbi:hypothetical protein [Burkholderia semiarida]|uniref:hypothetical protein n=1 Tax=Burkholderia semiarida TaxID=2843303 RepID=UPI0038780DB3
MKIGACVDDEPFLRMRYVQMIDLHRLPERLGRIAIGAETGLSYSAPVTSCLIKITGRKISAIMRGIVVAAHRHGESSHLGLTRFDPFARDLTCAAIVRRLMNGVRIWEPISGT